MKKQGKHEIHNSTYLCHGRLAFDNEKYDNLLHLYQGKASYEENAFCQVYLSSLHFYDPVDLQIRKIDFMHEKEVDSSSDTKLKVGGDWRTNKSHQAYHQHEQYGKFNND